MMSGGVLSMEMCLVWKVERMRVREGGEERKRTLTRHHGESLSQRKKKRNLKR